MNTKDISAFLIMSEWKDPKSSVSKIVLSE